MSKHLFGLVVTSHGTAANNRGENEGGNITTLQKILWNGEVHTTVSAEALRWAIRYYWQRALGDSAINRKWNQEMSDHKWQDKMWKGWNPDVSGGVIYADDDVLGFMEALAGTQETDIQYAIPRRERELREAEEEAEENEDAKALEKAREQKSKFARDSLELKEARDKLYALKKEQSEEIKKVEKQISTIRKRMGLKGVTLNRRGALEVTRAISLTPFAGDITFNAKSGEKPQPACMVRRFTPHATNTALH
ncbi:MAG: hypothetical protein ACREX4_15370 [Gammaproteobacteria bacterium]